MIKIFYEGYRIKGKKEGDLEIRGKKLTSKYNKDVTKYNISKIYETIIFINDNTF